MSEMIKKLPMEKVLHKSEVLPRKIHRPGGIPEFVECGETRLLEEAGCCPDYRNQKLPSDIFDIYNV